jgi:hypothetical protein
MQFLVKNLKFWTKICLVFLYVCETKSLTSRKDDRGCGNLQEYNRQSLLLQPDNSYSFGQTVQTVLPPSIRQSLLPKSSVRVTLQLTVSQSVGLGVEPCLGLMNRYLFLLESCCPVYMGRPLWREDGSVICQGQSVIMSLVSIYILFTKLHLLTNICTICTRPLSVQSRYSRLCTPFSNYRYYGSLVTWTVVSLTAAKFEPLIFPMSGFALSNVANVFIIMI